MPFGMNYRNEITPKNHLDKDALLKQITTLDFMALDLNLYLDTHPGEIEALQMHNTVVDGAKKARKQYETHFGPLTSCYAENLNDWTWADCPWPWQEGFNFKLNILAEERL